jgi:hypothetical protein
MSIIRTPSETRHLHDLFFVPKGMSSRRHFFGGIDAICFGPVVSPVINTPRRPRCYESSPTCLTRDHNLLYEADSLLISGRPCVDFSRCAPGPVRRKSRSFSHGSGAVTKPRSSLLAGAGQTGATAECKRRWWWQCLGGRNNYWPVPVSKSGEQGLEMEMRSDKYMGTPHRELANYRFVTDPLLDVTPCKGNASGAQLRNATSARSNFGLGIPRGKHP